MMLHDEIAASLFYLSSVQDSSAPDVYHDLSSRSSYVPEAYRDYFTHYIEYYKAYELFPSWEQFSAGCGLENSVVMPVAQARQVFHRVFQIWESQWLSARLAESPLADRRQYLDRLVRCLEMVDDSDSPVSSLSSYDAASAFIVDESDLAGQFRFPVKKLNDITVCREGSLISVCAGPGSGKTGFALNCVYQNSVLRDKKTLFIYLENSERAYQAELRSRFSFDNGMKVENRSLHQGILAEDSGAVEGIRRLNDDMLSKMKGEVYFKPFTDYPTDPLKFGSALARDINRLGIDFVVFDYLQKVKTYVPLRMDSMGYINQICSTLTSVALGGFDARPTVMMVLAQPNREAIAKAAKSRGNSYNLASLAEASSLERDSFVIIFLYSDEESKAANQMYYKVAKNRNGEGMVSMAPTAFIPQYCVMGDTGSDSGDDGLYSMDSLDSLFDVDLDF